MEIENLVKDCTTTSIELGKYSYEIIVQPRVTNRLYDKCHTNFMKLKSYGEEGIKEIEKMLDSENDYVKEKAAVHILPYRTKKALKTLKALAKKYDKQIGIRSFSIEMVIKEWKKGNLRDYFTFKYMISNSMKMELRLTPYSRIAALRLLGPPDEFRGRVTRRTTLRT